MKIRSTSLATVTLAALIAAVLSSSTEGPHGASVAADMTLLANTRAPYNPTLLRLEPRATEPLKPGVVALLCNGERVAEVRLFATSKPGTMVTDGGFSIRETDQGRVCSVNAGRLVFEIEGSKPVVLEAEAIEFLTHFGDPLSE